MNKKCPRKIRKEVYTMLYLLNLSGWEIPGGILGKLTYLYKRNVDVDGFVESDMLKWAFGCYGGCQEILDFIITFDRKFPKPTIRNIAITFLQDDYKIKMDKIYKKENSNA